MATSPKKHLGPGSTGGAMGSIKDVGKDRLRNGSVDNTIIDHSRGSGSIFGPGTEPGGGDDEVVARKDHGHPEDEHPYPYETGRRGEEGMRGAPGVVGASGPIGPLGPPGMDGQRGVDGSMGPMGPIGPTGAIGARGPIGDPGTRGPEALGNPPGVGTVVFPVPAGAGSFAVTQVTVTLPFPASRRHSVNVIDAAMIATDKILVSLAGVAETQANASDSVDPLAMQALAKAGSFDFQVSFLTPAAGPLVVNYTRSA